MKAFGNKSRVVWKMVWPSVDNGNGNLLLQCSHSLSFFISFWILKWVSANGRQDLGAKVYRGLGLKG